MLVLLVFIGWLVCIAFSTMLGRVRGRTGAGFAAGFLLGPVGVICAGLLERNDERVDTHEKR